jgi:hypothetical protein
VGVPVEDRELVVVAKPYLGLTSLALEPANRLKPIASLDQNVATERAFKSQVDRK